jgi:hypothetical protein
MGLMNDDTSTSKYNISMNGRSRDAMYRHIYSAADCMILQYLLHISFSASPHQQPSRCHYINLPSPNYSKIKLTLGFLIKQMRNGNQKPKKKKSKNKTKKVFIFFYQGTNKLQWWCYMIMNCREPRPTRRCSSPWTCRGASSSSTQGC